VLRDGPLPQHQVAPDRRRLALQLALVLRRDAQKGVHWGEMAVLTPTNRDANYLREQLRRRDIPLRDLHTWNGQPDNAVKLGTVHRAKGLDFAAVYLPQLRPPATPTTGEPGTGERQLLYCGYVKNSSPVPGQGIDSGSERSVATRAPIPEVGLGGCERGLVRSVREVLLPGCRAAPT
jgi:superfamily I DNA/RNA helicase